MRPLQVALLLLLLPLLAACGRGEDRAGEPAASARPGQDEEIWVAAFAATPEDLEWSSLPEVDGLEALSPRARSAALAATEMRSCPCGCGDHTVAYCLHEVDGCLTAQAVARELVAEAARRARRLPPEPPPPVPELGAQPDGPPAGEPAPTGEPAEELPAAGAEEAPLPGG